MRFHNITKEDMLNGDGLRVVLWTAGCSHGCKGCHNPVTWDAEGGIPFDEAAWQEIAGELGKKYISGITFSGGDPLYLQNRKDTEALIRRVRAEFPDKTVWLYTGFTWEEIKELPFISLVDTLVDGRFVEELKDSTLKWRGSSNQRVIDVKKSLNGDRLVLHAE